jgi:hypothetical protein
MLITKITHPPAVKAKYSVIEVEPMPKPTSFHIQLTLLPSPVVYGTAEINRIKIKITMNALTALVNNNLFFNNDSMLAFQVKKTPTAKQINANAVPIIPIIPIADNEFVPLSRKPVILCFHMPILKNKLFSVVCDSTALFNPGMIIIR